MPRRAVQKLRKVCLAAGLSFPLSADFAHRLAPLPWFSSSTVSAEVQDRLGYAACRDSESLKARPRRESGRFRFVLECADIGCVDLTTAILFLQILPLTSTNMVHNHNPCGEGADADQVRRDQAGAGELRI